MESLPTPIRWALVPLVTIVVTLIVSIVVNVIGLALAFLFGPSPVLNENVVGYILSPGVGCFASVIAAVNVAPSHQNRVAIIVGALWVLFSGVFAYLFVIAGEWPSLLSAVAIAFASWLAVTSANYD